MRPGRRVTAMSWCGQVGRSPDALRPSWSAAVTGAVLASVIALAPGSAVAWNCPVQIRAAEEAIKRAEAMNLGPDAKNLIAQARKLLDDARKDHDGARAKIDHANAMWKAKAALAQAESAAAISSP